MHSIYIMIELYFFSLDQWEIRTHLLWGKCFNIPHHCDPHLNQTKFNGLSPLTIADSFVKAHNHKWLNPMKVYIYLQRFYWHQRQDQSIFCGSSATAKNSWGRKALSPCRNISHNIFVSSIEDCCLQIHYKYSALCFYSPQRQIRLQIICFVVVVCLLNRRFLHINTLQIH